MNLIIVHLLLTYTAIRVTKSAPPPSKHVFFQIDEFIKQLMTSEKFDELTDVIADKAAQKIKYIESHITASERNKDTLRHSDMNKKKDTQSEENTNHEDKTDRHSENQNELDRKSSDKHKYNYHDKSREKGSRSNEKINYDRERKRDEEPASAERSNHDLERHREKDTKSNERKNGYRDDSEPQSKNDNRKGVKFGKIDTQTFLKNHMNSKELELNFKHLTGELEKHRFNIKENPKTNKGNDKKHSGHDEKLKSEEQLQTGSDKHENAPVKKSEGHDEETNDSKEAKITDSSSNENKEAHEQDNFHETDKKSREVKPANESEAIKEDRRQAEPKYNTHASNEKPIPRMQQQNEETDELFKSFEGLETSLEEENQNNMSPNQELIDLTAKEAKLVEEGKNDARSDETKKIVSEENLSIPERIPIVNSSNPNKRPAREENGKLFVFETSPEYAEYHENVAKQNQQKYINTYKKKK